MHLPEGKVSSVEGQAEHHLPSIHCDITEHVKPRVQRGGSESGDNHQQRGVLEIHGHPQDIG